MIYTLFLYKIFLNFQLFLTSSNREFCSTEKKTLINMLIFAKSAIKSHIYFPLNSPEL